MRADLNAILQTLTPEAASVLKQSVAEAARRGHSQTTPLHVAATLLASPSGLLRQACARSHPATSHPLRCRALELCFSVALDRLSSSNPTPSASSAKVPNAAAASEDPPTSNALVAALKRAQGNQRRGCPEQQQLPLLAVKVELGQLVVSILDDPGVSRVMREASFSSPKVKATIEQSLAAAAAEAAAPSTPSISGNSVQLGGAPGGIIGTGFSPAPAGVGTPRIPADRNLYVNPRLPQQQHRSRGGPGGGPDGLDQHKDDAQKVLDVLLRTRKRNPVLVGDSRLETVTKEVLQRIEKMEVDDGRLRNVEVISLEIQLGYSKRSEIPFKLPELVNSVDARFKSGAASMGIILDLGDLKWLVEGPGRDGGGGGISPQQLTETSHSVVTEMAKLLSRFGGSGGRVWLVGRASSATYLRCQVSHPTIEDDWDLHAVPIAPRALLPAMSLASLPPQKRFPQIGAAASPAEKVDSSRGDLCPVCKDSYEHELAKLVAMEFEKSSLDSKAEHRESLPPWLQVAKLCSGSSKSAATQLQAKEQELMWKRTTEELLKRWTDTCSRLHPLARQPAVQVPNLTKSSLRLRRSPPAKFQTETSSGRLQLSKQLLPPMNTSSRSISPPASPVRTDLVLGVPSTEKIPKPVGEDDPVQKVEPTKNLDFDVFKKLFRGLAEKVDWQPEAASAVATAVMQCKSGCGKSHGGVGAARGDTWFLFYGPDKVGKKQMATALSELLAGGAPVTVRFGSSCSDGAVSSRGKTALDRVVDTVRRDPSSVVVLEDVDRADTLVAGSLRRAMERGRMTDSHGREVALGNVTVVLISETSPVEHEAASLQRRKEDEEKLLLAAKSRWQLELVVEERSVGKRRREWPWEEDPRAVPKRRVAPSLDLNLAVAASSADEDTAENSRNSSDLTVEHDQKENARLDVLGLAGLPSSTVSELSRAVDEAVAFKPVDFGALRRRVSETITKQFEAEVGGGRALRVDEEALDRVVGAVWFGTAPASGFEEWVETLLVPSFRLLRDRPAADGGGALVRLLLDKDGGGVASVPAGSWLPTRIRLAVEGGAGV